MDSCLTPAVRVCPDAETASRAAAAGIADDLRSAVQVRGQCSLALSGGRTPRVLYRSLAGDHRGEIPWDRVHIFWGDERYVPPEDPRSNYRLVRESLLDSVPIPGENIHRTPTGFSNPEDSAREYEEMLRRHFASPWPRFDLVLLGVGPDGHTASLFPGSPAVDERERWVVATRAPVEPALRVTLTLPVLNRAAHVHFLVTGADKATAVKQALKGPANPRICPAAAVRPVDGAVVWWLDQAAAELLGAQGLS